MPISIFLRLQTKHNKNFSTFEDSIIGKSVHKIVLIQIILVLIRTYRRFPAFKTTTCQKDFVRFEPNVTTISTVLDLENQRFATFENQIYNSFSAFENSTIKKYVPKIVFI